MYACITFSVTTLSSFGSLLPPYIINPKGSLNQKEKKKNLCKLLLIKKQPAITFGVISQRLLQDLLPDKKSSVLCGTFLVRGEARPRRWRGGKGGEFSPPQTEGCALTANWRMAPYPQSPALEKKPWTLSAAQYCRWPCRDLQTYTLTHPNNAFYRRSMSKSLLTVTAPG